MAERSKKGYRPKLLPHQYIILGYATVIILLVLTIVAKNHFLLFFFLTIFATILNYQTNMTPMRFNPHPEIFAGLILAKVIGFHASMLMILVPTLFVDIYTARLDFDTFLSLMFTLLICYLMSTISLPFMALALMLIMGKFIVCLLINIAMGISPVELLLEHVLGFVFNMIAMLSFGDYFIHLFT